MLMPSQRFHQVTMFNQRLPIRPFYPQFDSLIQSMDALSYWELRRFLWHRVRPKLERFLYRFRELTPNDPVSISRVHQIIVGSQLWLSSPEDFNDPFDMSAEIVVEGNLKEKQKRFSEMIKSHGVGLGWKERKKLLPTFVSKSNEELAVIGQRSLDQNVRGAGVCSFGGDVRSIPMWAHYSASHKGICLQFEVARDHATFTQAVPVEYNQQYPKVNWLKEYHKSIQAVMLRKHPDWSYEKEHRIVIPDGARRHHPFRPEALTGVILGCRVNDSVVNKLKEMLVERADKGFQIPDIYQAQLHPRQYQLVIKKYSIGL
jgi:hypothetical protein